MPARSWFVAAILLPLWLLSACDSDEESGQSFGDGGADGAEGGTGGGFPSGASSDEGGRNDEGQAGEGQAGEGQAGEAGASADVAHVRFANAIFGSKTAHASLLDYELYPFDPYIVDVYLEGRREPLFTSVAPGNEDAVTSAIALPSGARTVRFELRVSGVTPESEPLLVSEPVDIPPGSNTTLIAAGDVGPNAEHAGERAVLLPMIQTAEARLDATPRVRVISAAHLQHVYVSLDDVAIANLIQYAVSSEAGVEVKEPPARITVTGKDSAIFGGAAFFTVPSDLFAKERDYVLVVTGMGQIRSANDPLGLCLLVIPADSDAKGGSAVRLLQDPVVAWLNALRPSQGPPLVVDVLAGDRSLAKGLTYAQKVLSFSTLRPEDDGAPVRIVDSGTASVVYEASTGSLQVGQRYLAVMSGDPRAEDETRSPQLSLVPDKLPLDPRFRQVALLQAVVGLEALEFGNWDTKVGGEQGSTFTPVLGPLAFREASSLYGTQFSLPKELETGAVEYGYFGVHAAASSEYFASDSDALVAEPSFLVVSGDWESDDALDLFQVTLRQVWSVTSHELFRFVPPDERVQRGFLDLRNSTGSMSKRFIQR